MFAWQQARVRLLETANRMEVARAAQREQEELRAARLRWAREKGLKSRRLACVPTPQCGEAFASWVARSADTPKVTIDQMLGYLELSTNVSVVRNGVELTAERLESVTAASGLAEGQADVGPESLQIGDVAQRSPVGPPAQGELFSGTPYWHCRRITEPRTSPPRRACSPTDGS
ncbi:hypothetical protein [Saccharothrix lopnurensis]|uniref:Uncharacterized protein n=1 Tax=Saccharothrix lopnurensis TaxID=1670621 RepID=A0ABW1NXM1_9PSEU